MNSKLTRAFYIICLHFLPACTEQEELPEKNVRSFKPSQPLRLAIQSLTAADAAGYDMRFLAQDPVAGSDLSKLSPDALSTFGEKALPRLAKNGYLAFALSIMSNEQSALFRQTLEEYFLIKHERREFDDEYYNCILVMRRHPNPKFTDALFEDLKLAPITPYDPRDRDKWYTEELIKKLNRGAQGQIAMALLEMDSPSVRGRYHQLIGTSSGPFREVLIWALGRSPSVIDFRLLRNILDQSKKPDEILRMRRTVNAFPLNLEVRANELENELLKTDAAGLAKIAAMRKLAEELRLEIDAAGLKEVFQTFD